MKKDYRRYKVWNVDFETDGYKLPKEYKNWITVISITNEDFEEYILNDETNLEMYLSDKVSDITGWLHNGFNYREMKLKYKSNNK